MAILAMTSHGQDARATANDATTWRLQRQVLLPATEQPVLKGNGRVP
jgi:hypothetical protein